MCVCVCVCVCVVDREYCYWDVMKISSIAAANVQLSISQFLRGLTLDLTRTLFYLKIKTVQELGVQAEGEAVTVCLGGC